MAESTGIIVSSATVPMDRQRTRPRLAVFKFASCDGCQLQLLSCEDELLLISEQVEIVHFLEATSHSEPGPYDIALVEGSITTPEDRKRIQNVREHSKYLVTLGACATAGGIQALKNWADRSEFLRCVYAHPSYIETLATSTAIRDHVAVDFELRGCPINRFQLLEVIRSLLQGRRPKTPSHAVCLDCKLSGTVCIAVSSGTPCLGPITQSGCGAICPRYNRGCYGCFGPVVQANCDSLADKYLDQGVAPSQLVTLMRNFNANAPEFRETGDRIDPAINPGELQ
jgi:sulfhydrogenase subunit delta